jgi:hypothetical protein
MTPSTPERTLSMGLGVLLAGVACFGAFVGAWKMEGSVSYLAIAAPLVAAAAALIPVVAEDLWRDGQYVKSVLMWVVLLPCAAYVFLGNAERVHHAKAGAEAERVSYAKAAERSQTRFDEAKLAATEAAKALGRWRGKTDKECPPGCQRLQAADEAAQAELETAREELRKAEAKSTAPADLAAPAWLLPLCLDAAAFMLIWSGLTGPKPRPRIEPEPKPDATQACSPAAREETADVPLDKAAAEAPARRPGRAKIKKTVVALDRGAAPDKAAPDKLH